MRKTRFRAEKVGDRLQQFYQRFNQNWALFLQKPILNRDGAGFFAHQEQERIGTAVLEPRQSAEHTIGFGFTQFRANLFDTCFRKSGQLVIADGLFEPSS